MDNYLLAEPALKKLCSSRLRAGILFSLERPVALCELRRMVNANAPNTSAKAKDLQAMGLIKRENGEYKLTGQGEFVRRRFKELVDALALLERFHPFWAELLDEIPLDLLDGIEVLVDSEVVESDSANLDKAREILLKLMKESSKLAVVLPGYSKSISDAFLEFEGDATILAKKSVLDRLGANRHERGFLECDPKIGLFVGDAFVALTNPQVSKALVNLTPNGIEWGKRMFKHFMRLQR